MSQLSYVNITKLFEYPLKQICFFHIFVHLTFKDLLHLRNVCKKSFRLINEYFDHMEYVDFSPNFTKNLKSSWPRFFLLLRNNKSICDLNLSNCKWIDENGFIHIIRQQNRLKFINLSSTFKITNRSLDTMALHCPFLETIILENCGWLHPDTLHKIADNCHQLTNVNIGSCWNLDDESVRILLEKRGNSIKSLILSRIYSLSDETLLSIKMWAIVLNFLDISFCWKITDSGLKHLCECQNLRRIVLNGCLGITCLGYQYLKESNMELV